jgi:hypothetical protein
MPYRCAGCGQEFEAGTSCPGCGRPVDAASGGTPPVAAHHERVTVRLPRGVVVGGIAAMALALVAGAALAASSVLAPRQTSTGSAGAAAETKVSGQPPSKAGSWSRGVREVWRIAGGHSDGRDAGSFEAISLTKAGWAFSDLEGDVTSSVWAYSPESGKALWNASGSGGRNLACARQDLNGVVPCIDERSDSLTLSNWGDGEIVTTTKLSALGIRPASLYSASTHVLGGDIVVVLAQYPNASLPDFGDLGDVLVARISADAKTLRWQTTVRGCPYDSWKGQGWLPDAAMLQHGALFAGFGSAFDFESGRSLLAKTACAQPLADKAVYVESSGSDQAPAELVTTDGTHFAVVTQPNWLTLAGQLPPVALRVTDVSTTQQWEGGSLVGTAAVQAFDPGTGNALWSQPAEISVHQWDGTVTAGPVAFDGERLVFGGSEKTIAVDPKSGKVLWSRNGGASQVELGAKGQFIACYWGEGPAQCDLVEAATGATVADLGGQARFSVDPDGEESIAVLGMDWSSDTADAYLARLDPADRLSTASIPPAAAPACPTGMTPISWTQYADGAILLCQADQRFAVVYPAHPDWQARELNFTDGGHEVVFANGTRIRVLLGGSVVYTDSAGTVTSRPASQSWSSARGEVKLAVPADVPTCPVGSWPISLSTFDGGWLLVCGTAANAPTSMTLSAGGLTPVGSVSYRNGGYCGTSELGEVCGYRSPAVVSVKGSDGTVTQHSASSNYYDGYGEGGAGEGTGSYGVDAPKENAKDQVRYLTQILQKSMAGRANLDKAVNHVRSCTDVGGAISTLNEVVDNRQELLDALESTPVDAVPNGSELVAHLRNALQLSHDSDLVWVQWAQSEQAGGCVQGEANPLYVQVREMNASVARAKDSFLKSWNADIAPAYGVATFRTSQI